MDEVGKLSEKVALTTPELQKLSQRYVELTKYLATTARELAEAVDAVDVEKSTKLQGRMEEIVKKEDPLVEELNKFCQTP
jgi:predicted  nucleic acid-binding Zn-ribbon protein